MPVLGADGPATHGESDAEVDPGRTSARQAVRQMISSVVPEHAADQTLIGQFKDLRSTLGPVVDSVLSDSERLAVLHRTGLLDGPTRSALDHLGALTAAAVGSPYAAVSLVDQDKQVFVGCSDRRDESERTRPLEQSICKYAVASGEPLIVDDTLEHPLFVDSPVVHEGTVRSYAGIPLADVSGHTIGTLCVWDDQPQHWTGSQIQILDDLAAVVRAKIFAG